MHRAKLWELDEQERQRATHYHFGKALSELSLGKRLLGAELLQTASKERCKHTMA